MRNTDLSIIKIDTPDMTQVRSTVFDRATDIEFIRLSNLYSNGKKYYSWSKFKHVKLEIKDVSVEEAWAVIHKWRTLLNDKTPVKDESGEFYSLARLTKADKILHDFDLLAGRQVFMPKQGSKKGVVENLLQSSLREEAIASSMLEGAHTTRKAARKMLLEGRSPANRAEIMIANNYLTMQLMEKEYRYKKMDVDLLFEMHHNLTKNDLSADEQFRFRTDVDGITVGDSLQNTTAYYPPKEKFLHAEIDRFLQYVNDEDSSSNEYIHPVVKAIIAHFWLAILHPFVDGNGRLARCVFYWYLLKKDYEAAAYVPISTTILRSPSQYSEAFLLSEQDGFDLTYFYDYHLDKIQIAIDDFNRYIEKQEREQAIWERILNSHGIKDYRQIKALSYLLNSRAAYITYRSQMNIAGVERVTAYKDLSGLAKLGWLRSIKEGRTILYFPTEKLKSIRKAA
jgi:Fic family protein